MIINMHISPGEQLVRKLEELRKRLNNSGTERTVGLKDSLGADCPFYKKSLDRFLRQDYVDIRNLTYEISKLIKVIEHHE